MKIKSLKKVSLKDKRVFLRVDFNVPIKNNKIQDDSRMQATLPTIKYLLKQKAKIIIVSHLGRPDSKKVKELKMDLVAKHLSKLLKKPIKKLDECIGVKVESVIKKMKSGEMVFLENIRFYKEEEKNDKAFAKKLAQLADVFVNDAFGACHRAHASTYGIAKILPSYAGFLLEKEITILWSLMKKVKKPLTIIIGGAKIDTKIGLIENFIDKADNFLIGGALASTFLCAQGFNVGKSLYEKDKLKVAQEIMLKIESAKKNIYLPFDVIVADEIKENAKTLDLPVEDVISDMKILDIGTKSAEKFAEVLKKSKTVIWNGPIGLYEFKVFSKGTFKIASTLSKLKNVQTIIGGGDTIDAIKHFGFKEKQFTHISTGGGAMLEFLEGKTLPGVEVVLD